MDLYVSLIFIPLISIQQQAEGLFRISVASTDLEM